MQLDALGLTTGDEEFPLTYTLANDGKTITAQANGETIFTVTLSAVASGIDVLADVTLVLEQPINHLISNDSITLPLIIDGKDLDGTALEQGQFDWIIQDGVDPVLTSTSNAAVDEANLINGSVSDTGTFNLNVGSDFVESIFFDAADQPQLFSGGVQIIYVVSADGSELVGYIGSESAENKAFTLSFTSPSGEADTDVTYTFELFKGLDQDNITDELPFVVTARDDDNDETKLTLNVSVTDGGEPTIGSGMVELSEIPVADSTPSGVGSTANVSLAVTAGNDPLVFLGLDVTTGQAVLDSDGIAVTSNGEALTWRDNGNGTFDARIPDFS